MLVWQVHKVIQSSAWICTALQRAVAWVWESYQQLIAVVDVVAFIGQSGGQIAQKSKNNSAANEVATREARYAIVETDACKTVCVCKMIATTTMMKVTDELINSVWW